MLVLFQIYAGKVIQKPITGLVPLVQVFVKADVLALETRPGELGPGGRTARQPSLYATTLSFTPSVSASSNGNCFIPPTDLYNYRGTASTVDLPYSYLHIICL
jgi:hypothetical protein